MEGLSLMLTGMLIVFFFLFLLIVMMKFIPIITKKRQKPNKVEPEAFQQSNPPAAKPLEPSQSGELEVQRDRARTVAAIAAALTATMGKAPKSLIVTTPTGETTRHYNSWSYSGSQDLMEVGDLQGQRGFQY